MTVIIKVDTGFVGGEHEEDTGLEVEDWNSLTDEERTDWLNGTLFNFCQVYAEDEENPKVELKQ